MKNEAINDALRGAAGRVTSSTRARTSEYRHFRRVTRALVSQTVLYPATSRSRKREWLLRSPERFYSCRAHFRPCHSSGTRTVERDELDGKAPKSRRELTHSRRARPGRKAVPCPQRP